MPKKILVVDDSPAIRSMAESLLSQEGYEVLCASKGTEALELVKMTKPDLVFLDHDLPDLDGEKICEQIKSQDDLKEIPVVVLLGTNEVKKQGRFKDLGADGFVLKPFTPKELLTQVELFFDLKASSVKEERPKSQTHGYDWFISEMKKEFGEVMPEKSKDAEKTKVKSEDEVTLSQTQKINIFSQDEGEGIKGKELNSQNKGFDNFIFNQKEGEDTDSSAQGMIYSELKFDDSPESKSSEQKSTSVEVGLSDSDYKEMTDRLLERISSKVAEKIVSMIDRKILEEEIKKGLEEL